MDAEVVIYLFFIGDVNVTFFERWKNTTALQYLVEGMLPAQAGVKSVACEDVDTGANCTDNVIKRAVDSDSAVVTIYNLSPGTLYQLVFEFSVGVVGVHYKTLYACSGECEPRF